MAIITMKNNMLNMAFIIINP